MGFEVVVSRGLGTRLLKQVRLNVFPVGTEFRESLIYLEFGKYCDLVIDKF